MGTTEKTPEHYQRIIDQKNARIRQLKNENKRLLQDQIIRGKTSEIRAAAMKEGYNTCKLQNAAEIEELKAKIRFIDMNVARFLNLEMPVSKFYEVMKRGG